MLGDALKPIHCGFLHLEGRADATQGLSASTAAIIREERDNEKICFHPRDGPSHVVQYRASRWRLPDAADHPRCSVRRRQRQRHDLPDHRQQARSCAWPAGDCRGSSGRRWRARRTLRPSPAGGWLYAVDGNQLAAVRRSVFAQGRQLRPGEGFRTDYAGRQLHADASRQSQPADPFGQGDDRLYAKANPGSLTFATGNTAGIVALETIKHDTGISMLHVPYKSTPPALEDIIAGRVSMTLADFTTAMPHVGAGTLRPLAVSRIRRSSLFPDLPTMDEAGIKGFNLDTWAGLVAPAGTPPQIVTKLNGALRKIIDSPETQAQFKNIGFEGFSSTPEELGDFIKAQLALWGKMIKDAHIQLD